MRDIMQNRGVQLMERLIPCLSIMDAKNEASRGISRQSRSWLESYNG
jgi:hypothetical protein